MPANQTVRSRSLPALALLWLAAANAGAATLTLRVSVPASTPPGDTLYVAGSFQGWNPGSAAHALNPLPDGRWGITLSLPDNAPIEFKFTRGSWQTVEKGPAGEEIPNRRHTPVGAQTIDLVVASWAGLPASTISGTVETFALQAFLGGRTCRVYLPPGYAGGTARYPVLYMHDGQNLFDAATSFAGEWRVDEACEALIASGEIRPLIVVGIDNGPDRCDAYTPFTGGGSPCVGGGADAYLTAIRDVLMPEIAARYRVRSGPDDTSMAGSSLGGLVSAYAGYAHADTFGRIAAVSPSYWWANQAMRAFAEQRGRPAALDRFYQDMGTAESGSAIPHLRAVRDVALAQGFVEGEDFRSAEFAGHAHSEAYWAQRFPGVLRFLIDPPACAPADTAPNFGTLDVNDVIVYVSDFALGDLDADLWPSGGDGLLDVNDLVTFVTSFAAGCP